METALFLMTIMNAGLPNQTSTYHRIEGTMQQCEYAIATRQPQPNVKWHCVRWVDGRLEYGSARMRSDPIPAGTSG